MPRSRHHAYRAFETAVLIDLFLVQPFTLLDTGFAGLTQVFIDLGLVASLRYLLSEEVAQHHHVDSWTPRPPAVEAATM